MTHIVPALNPVVEDVFFKGCLRIYMTYGNGVVPANISMAWRVWWVDCAAIVHCLQRSNGAKHASGSIEIPCRASKLSDLDPRW